jgi:hypothetical protein
VRVNVAERGTGARRRVCLILNIIACCSSNYRSLKLMHLFIHTFIYLFLCGLYSVSLLSCPRLRQVYLTETLHPPRHFLTVAMHGVTIKGTSWVSGFFCDVKEICTLLGHYAASNGNPLPTFRVNVSVPSSRVKNSKKTSCPRKMGPIRWPETSVKDYHSTLLNIPEEGWFQGHLVHETVRISESMVSDGKIISEW